MTTTTMQQIRNDFAATVLKETGAVVEFTAITSDRFSVYTEDGARFSAVVDMIKRISGVTYSGAVIWHPAGTEYVPFGGAQVYTESDPIAAGAVADYVAFFTLEPQPPTTNLMERKSLYRMKEDYL